MNLHIVVASPTLIAPADLKELADGATAYLLQAGGGGKLNPNDGVDRSCDVNSNATTLRRRHSTKSGWGDKSRTIDALLALDQIATARDLTLSHRKQATPSVFVQRSG